MEIPRFLWLGATTVAIGALLMLMALHPERRSGPTRLPDIPVHSIVVDPDDPQRLYLGTDLGVMVSIDGGRTWRTPAGRKELFAFTDGRGAWRVTLR